MKKTVDGIKRMKNTEKISMLTCYDYSFARAIDGKVDILLIGDSLGNVVLGYERTTRVLMEDMLRHVAAVARGTKNSLIIGDLPFGTYETPADAISNARKLRDAGADAVKPEGKPEIIQALTADGIEVMAHLGLLPQTAEKMGVIGKHAQEAERLIEEARIVQQAGAFSLILECIPTPLAEKVTHALDIPTIGIGAGNTCDGQVLVLYDLLGLFGEFQPKFVRRYLNLKEEIGNAVGQYSQDVKELRFPSEEESFNLNNS